MDESSSSDDAELARLRALLPAAPSDGEDEGSGSEGEGPEALVLGRGRPAPAAAAPAAPAGRGAALRGQLAFLGRHFRALESQEVRHVVETAKARSACDSFEWERNEARPEWKQGLLLATSRPMEGLRYLHQHGLLKPTPEARARWLSHYRRMLLDNALIVEWLCLPAHADLLARLVAHENAFGGLDLDVALRRFVRRLDYVPLGEPLQRLLLAFGAEYVARNPHRREVASPEAAAHLARGMLAINNAIHNRASKQKKIRVADWLAQSAGKNAGQDFPPGLVEEFYANVVTLPLAFDSETEGYQDEVRHGWLAHRLLDHKGWKRHWAVLTEAGQLALLPEDGAKAVPPVILDLKLAVLRESKPLPEGRGAVLSLQIGPSVHVLQFASVWARDAWRRHVQRHADAPDGKGMAVALREQELSPSPIRSALKGKQRRLSAGKPKPMQTIRLGGAVAPPPEDEGDPDEALPPGALEAFNRMNLDEDL